jgi:hypothetical protein
MPSPANLDEVMKLSSLRDKTAAEVSDIWLQFHSDVSKHRVGSVMTSEEYRDFRLRAKER